MSRRGNTNLRIVFELSAEDLAQFRRALKKAREKVRSADELEIIEATKHALDRLPIGSAPPFVRERIQKVQRLVQMFEDEEWSLSRTLRAGLLDALVYFSDPDDMIPDHIGVIGLLDDAIMLELVLRSHRAVLDAYDDFCAFRDALGAAVPGDDEARHDRARRLARRRAALTARMRSETVGLKSLVLRKS
jgi:hypothetical protein